jgi:DNA invertase Pin-like site-specific DNA recombinase
VHEIGGIRALGDPIDTAGPSGMLVLQIMGAIAQFERALIVERTETGARRDPRAE